MDLTNKGKALLRFLKEAATIRRPRMPGYRSDDRVLWFSGIPRDSQEIRSPLLVSPPDDSSDFWLEVRKTPPPARKPIPPALADWVRLEDLDSPQKEPELKKEITVLVEREIPDPDAPPEDPRTIKDTVEEIHRLEDHPEIDDAWVEYYVTHWEPWAEMKRRWYKVYQVYEEVDFMRRRLEEAEERYELFLGVGLLQWRDSTDKTIKRHLLTGSAEIVFDAGRGLITVVPAASFETFKPELDMLELTDQPRLEGSKVQDELEELDTRAWDTKKLGEILREIANRTRGGSQVDEEAFEPARAADSTFRVFFAPALILRERRPTAFEEVVTRLLENSDTSSEETSSPWRRFLAEGQPLSEDDHAPGDPEKGIPVGHEYFPLPTNAEQRQIIQRLQSSAGVVVKGPPGTGKSHTIANLVCHLLATGEKILITAQAPKALTVLRDMLPRDLRDLCLISLGSSREDQRQLESGVRTIIGKKNRWDQGESNWAEEKIADLEKGLRSLKEELSQVERQLRESREAETFPHVLPGGYEGTAARIARRLDEERESYGWLPETLHDNPPFPLNQPEVQLLAEMHAKLTSDLENELQFLAGDFSLPSPEEFRRLMDDLKAAEDHYSQAQDKAEPRKFSLIQTSPKEDLERAAQGLRNLDEHALRTTRALGNLAEKILPDLLLAENLRWNQLSEKVSAIIAQIETLLEQVGGTEIRISADCEPMRLRADAERRLAYLEQGRWRGFWVIRPKIIKETRYLEAECRRNGLSASDPDSLGKLIAYLKLKAAAEEFLRLWPDPVGDGHLENHLQFSITAKEKVSALGRLLEVFEKLGEECFACIPLGERINLAYPSERMLWLAAIEAELGRRAVQEARQPIDECRQKIHASLESGNAHPCLYKLAQALEERDSTSWREAFENREAICTQQERYKQYQALMARLEQANAPLASLVRQHQGDPQWHPRLVELEKAWFWASARGWLEDVTDRRRYEELVQRYHRLKERIQSRTKEVASALAWQAFFDRLDDFTIQNLLGWIDEMHLYGQGTGRFAYRHRRTARGYLNKCLPKIPAWIMPLHKLWATIEATPGLFDTVIIDEASQADLSSLALFSLAKRIIVVGDKMQNSPEAVGIREDDIARLIRDHLQEFHFRDRFRPDSSLYDHAGRAFHQSTISLREHFRCVPEIIRFSNDLCYREAPLVPLRQAPVDRLMPLEHTFIPGGYCEGDGQRIKNEVEADELVQTIFQCLNDPAYDGKSMGVIVLQGRTQADLIERKLAAALDPRIIAERKLRCGVPATFQGDQRDVIFLSMVISPDRRFRAVAELDFVRRYNVAMSRARDQVWLFHSVQQSDLSPDCLRRRLLRFLESPWPKGWEGEELDRLEREAVRTPRRPGDQPEPYESWFEVDVALELLRRKYRVLPQYEVADYRIDLVIEGLESRLAVECDGDAWHGPDRYDADMDRQRQLERAGWTFVRLRESEFYLNRNRVIKEVIKACEDLGIFSLDMEYPPSKPEEEKPAGIKMAAEDQPEDEPLEPEEVAEEATAVAGPFTGYSEDMDFPDPREAPVAHICTALKEIIEKDGPLTRSSLYRLYIEGCPHLHRSGRAVRDRLNVALRTLLKAGEIVQEDELGSGKPEGLVIRAAGTPTIRLRPAGRRKLEEIPPSEIFLVLDRLQVHPADGLPDDEELFFRKILEHFGFSQLTRTRKKHLQNLLNRFRQRGQHNQPNQEATAGGRALPGLLFTHGPLFEKD